MEVKTVLNSKAHDAVKRSINAPCLVVEFDKRGNKVRHAPSVDCEWNCENCGFNPLVKKRRLEKLGNRKNDN